MSVDVELLQIHQPTFLSDIITLAIVGATSLLDNSHVPWEIRSKVVDFTNTTLHLSPVVYHIKRELNG
jgi:hypothetical protein